MKKDQHFFIQFTYHTENLSINEWQNIERTLNVVYWGSSRSIYNFVKHYKKRNSNSILVTVSQRSNNIKTSVLKNLGI